MKIRWGEIILYATVFSLAIFTLEILILYFATGVYLYQSVTLIGLATWIMDYFGILVTSFSITTGVLASLVRYIGKNAKQIRFAKGLGISGGILSVLSSLFFLCCAPYIAAFTILTGTVALTIIKFSEELFMSGIFLQVTMIAYLTNKLYHEKENIGCECNT